MFGTCLSSVFGEWFVDSPMMEVWGGFQGPWSQGPRVSGWQDDRIPKVTGWMGRGGAGVAWLRCGLMALRGSLVKRVAGASPRYGCIVWARFCGTPFKWHTLQHIAYNGRW